MSLLEETQVPSGALLVNIHHISDGLVCSVLSIGKASTSLFVIRPPEWKHIDNWGLETTLGFLI